MVAHDSEGFEAGQADEFDVVKSFINRRCQTKDINEQRDLSNTIAHQGMRIVLVTNTYEPCTSGRPADGVCSIWAITILSSTKSTLGIV